MSKLSRTPVHKKIRQDGRPNGKAWKKHPKGFNTLTRSLVTVGQSLKGTTGAFLA